MFSIIEDMQNFHKELNKMAKSNTWRIGLFESFGYDPLWCKCEATMKLNYEMSDFNGGDG